jgi:hypothetical protein
MPNNLAIQGQLVCTAYDLTMDEWTAMPPYIRALYRAAYTADHLNVVEQPIGSNRGAYVDYYIHTAGLNPPEPWCAAFGTTMLVESGVPRESLPHGAASTHEWIHWANQTGNAVPKPQRGFAGIIVESPTSGHFVLCSHVNEDGLTFATIEGNTNVDGSREGYGVFRRERKIATINTWIDLSHLKAS